MEASEFNISTGIPRVSGGDPYLDKVCELYSKYSPRERG